MTFRPRISPIGEIHVILSIMSVILLVFFYYSRWGSRHFINRLLNWPKLLRLYADGIYSIFVPECVPYIIPHMFQ